MATRGELFLSGLTNTIYNIYNIATERDEEKGGPTPSESTRARRRRMLNDCHCGLGCFGAELRTYWGGLSAVVKYISKNLCFFALEVTTEAARF